MLVIMTSQLVIMAAWLVSVNLCLQLEKNICKHLRIISVWKALEQLAQINTFWFKSLFA